MSEYIVDLTDVEKRQFTWSIETLCNSVPVRGEIVRCRDCYFADEIESGYWCDRFECGKEPVTPGGFCAWAVKRKEDGDDR